MLTFRSGAECGVPVKALVICSLFGALIWSPLLSVGKRTSQESEFSKEKRGPGTFGANDDDDDWSSDQAWSAGGLLRCPPTCRCTETHVDCSGVGLLAIPSAKECPPDTVTMDLSGNRLTAFRATILSELRSLRELNVSHNQVSIIEEAGKASLPQLQTLDLSGNRLPCGCPLRGLISHMAKGGRLILDQEVEICLRDSSLLPTPCAAHYISCVWGPPRHVLHYSLITPGPFSNNSCLVLCFHHGYSYYGMDSVQRCLCGSVTPDDDDDDPCSGVCSRDGNIHMCNKSIIQDLHAVQVTILLSAPSYYNVLQPVWFQAEASIPATQFVWEFRDGSQSVVTANGMASHRYSLPGKYTVRVRTEAPQPEAETTVTMAVAVDMAELYCPAVAQTGQSLEVWLQANQGTDLQAVYSIQMADGQLLIDDSSCPRGGKVFRENLRCYWLNQVKESLSDARSRCRSIPGGDLAYITSAGQISFIQELYRSNSPVWVKISQSLKEENGRLLVEPDSSVHNIQEDCLRLSLLPGEAYQRSPCLEKAPSICECRGGVHLPDAPVYLVGVPIFDDAYTENATLSLSNTIPQHDIKVMVFPGLWFSHSGSLLALDLGIWPIQHELLVRIQILRPFCSPEQHLIPPGCVALWSPFATCNPQPLCNTTGDCPNGRQWCPLSETCLKLNRPCSTYTSTHYPHPPRFSQAPPSYSPVADVLLQLSPNMKERNIQVQLSHMSHSVHPEDILSIQHNGNQESFLRCKSSPDSPWRQTYASMTQQGWLEDSFLPDSATWFDNVVCDLRVIYGSELRSLVVSSLLSSFQEEGTCVFSAALSNGVSSTVASCDITILSPVSDLQIIYPALGTDCLHVVTHHPTLVVISAQSSSPAHVQWSTVAQSGESMLQQECPSDVSSKVSVCTTLSINVGFAWMWMNLDHPQTTRLTILVTNEVSSINLTMPIQSHDVIQGLRIHSDGPDLVNLSQTRIFTAEVTQGSSVTFTWTMDNNEGFSYKGASYMVTFRTPGVYKLKLFAQNPISFQEEEILLQVEGSLPLPEAELLVSSTVLLASESQTILFRIQVQRSSDVAISWDFGDDSPLLNRSFCAPHDMQNSNFLVTLNDTEHHVYAKESHYQVTVKAYTDGSEITMTLLLQVVHRLSSVSLKVDHSTLEVRKSTLFSVTCLPSTFGVTVTWNFGDKSDIVQTNDLQTQHIYKSLGTYNVTATVTNGQSYVTGSLMVTIEEKIEGLQVLSNEPTELGAESIITCSLTQGTNVIWNFYMGDGITYSNQSKPSLTHTYSQCGNFTVRAVARNSLSYISSSIVIQIYMIHVNNVLPDVITSHLKTQFTADLTGPPFLLKFHWDFGDGSQSILVEGKAEVWHSYVAAGNYTLKLLVSGQKSSKIYSKIIIVEDQIIVATINASASVTNVSQLILFNASVQPPPDPVHLYWYQWDSGVGMLPLNSSSSEATWAYKFEGNYIVTLTVWNQVSQYRTKSHVTVQRPITSVSIRHNGGDVISADIEVEFTAVVSDVSANFLWNFGDSTYVDFGQNVSYTFHVSGNITVGVKVNNSVSFGETSVIVYVQIPITRLCLSADYVVARTKQKVNFFTSLSSGESVQYYWSMCNSCLNVTGPSNISHIFTDPGTYRVRVKAQNLVGFAETFLMVDVQEPIEGVNVHQENPCIVGYAGLTEPLTLTANVIKGTNLTFRWVLWPGPWESNNSSVSFYPTKLEVILAEVWVENALGGGYAQTQVKILERTRGVYIQKSASFVGLGNPVNVTVFVESGSELEYNWNLGEGSAMPTSQKKAVTLNFLTPGLKNITVTVSNALGSTIVSTVLTVQEVLSNLSIGIEDAYHSQAVLSHKRILLCGSVENGTDLMWKWTVSGAKKDVTYNTQNVSHIFTEPGQYWLWLWAWNLVSNASTSVLLLVEDPVSGFMVSTEKNFFCMEQEVNICPSVRHGTNVSFTLMVPQLNLTETLINNCGHFNFPFSGTFNILAVAYNKVSRANFSHSIQVAESLKGLKVIGLPSSWPVNQTMHLMATLESGYATSFQWTFQQVGQPEFTLMGQSIEFTFLKAGTLHVLLNVSNPSCFSTFTSSVIIQSPVTKVYLQSNIKEVFLNQCVTFFAVISDGSDLHFLWTFEGEDKNVTSMENTVEYCYSHEGNFVTHVSAFNLVSVVYAQTTVRVRSLACEQPQVQILEPPKFLYKSFGANFEISVNLRGCIKYKTVYLWQLYKGTDCSNDLLTAPELDTSKTFLSIPGRTLSIGIYCLLFTITLEGTPLSNNATHVFQVRHSSLVAQIQGGSKRIWPIDIDLALDGTQSYDPDLDERQKEMDMEYEWSVKQLENMGTSCPLPSLPGLPRISVIWAAPCPNNSFIFTLTIWKPGRPAATAQQIVLLQPGKVLPVFVQCISCHSSSPYQFSLSGPVILYGECYTCHNDTMFTWSAVDSLGNPLMLDRNTTTSGPWSPELVIRRGVLQNHLSYTFYLRAVQQRGSEWGESSIILIPNMPPTGGKCSLLPQHTLVWLETLLEYTCTGWRDPDSGTQLFYSLSVGLCSATSCQKLHLYRGLKSQYSVRPPAGRELGEIRVYVEVEDIQGARTLALNRTLLISVSRVSPGISVTNWLRNYSESILENMRVVGDTLLVIQLAMEMVTAVSLGDNITEEEHNYLRLLRNNVTHAVSSLAVSSMWEVAAVSAALTQCVGFRHDVDMPAWLNVLNATEKMIHVLNERGDQGQRPDADVPQNILTLLGGVLASSNSDDLYLTAIDLTKALTVSLGRSLVTGEEPLLLAVPGVRAQVTRVPTKSPLCAVSLCQTSKSQNLLHTLSSHRELLQVTMELDDNPFPSGLPPNLTISSQLAALEFTSIDGEPVPVKDLPKDLAIQLALPIRKDIALTPVSAFIPPRGSASVTVTTSMAHRSAGVHLHISFMRLNESDWSLEVSPGLLISYGPLQFFNTSDMQRIHTLKFSLDEENTRNLTLLLPSTWSGSLLEYQINITSLLSVSSVSVSVSLFSSLCQYFHVPSLTWRTDGMSPSNASLPHQAVCRAQHLTLFGASLFVPPHQLVWLTPSPRRWTLALLCCSILLSLYLLLVLITHKLDHLDLSWVGTIPLCGPQGQCRYWVLVKTGWRREAGTTAHVGINLYGLNKSGARHLNSRGGLTTGSLDMFQVETDTNLGEIWKIRVWHDNTGLSPSWFLQYVAVWDKQTDFLYFFLVNDWLSVENDRNGGRVEKEILATCPQEFSSFSQVFPQQLFLGLTDWHLWLSVWWRPARSRFTRVQRVTCCALALHFYMAICSLWYGAIGVQEGSSVIGLQSLVTWESIFIGTLVSVMVVPVQLMFSFLFRETRSLVFVEDSATSTQSTDQDIQMDASSLLSLPGKADSLLDISSLSCASINSSKCTFDLEKGGSWFAERSGPAWTSSCESLYDARGDILTESGLGFIQPLCKDKVKDQRGFLSSCSSGDDPLSLLEGSSGSPHFTLSDGNLLQSIAADTQMWKRSEESDSGRFSPRPDLGSPSTESGSSLMTENEDCYMTRCWSESHQWCKRKSFSSSSSCASEGTSNESELQECWDIPSASPSPFTTRIGIRWKPPGWLFPPWMLRVVYIMALMLLAGCFAVTVLYTSSLSEYGFFLWLISCICALLSSALFLEPLKVVLLSLYYALYCPPVLSEGMGLVEEPLIRKIKDQPDKVRAPGGFGLQQAKKEAGRVRALRSMIQSCTGYMVFLLLVLLMYFHISFHGNNIRLLRSAIKQSITDSIDNNTIRSVPNAWHWLHITLPAHLYQDRRLKLVRSPRLCQLHSLPSNVLGWASTFQSLPLSEPNNNFTVGSNFPLDYSSLLQKPCLELGDTKEKTLDLIRALENFHWISKSILQVEITQYHKDVGLYISTIVHVDLSPYANKAFRLSIIPFHLEKPGHGLNLPMALAFSLLLAALLFLYPELAALVGFCSSGSSYSPHWTRLLLGLASAATGLVHIGRVWLTKHRMEQYQAKPWVFISLYDVALLSRTQAALSATLLLLIMLKVTQQFRFVRRWAVFVKTFQSLWKELPGLVLFIAALLLVLTHCMKLVAGVLLPAHSISCNKFSDFLWNGRSFWPMLKCDPSFGWLGLSVLLVCRGLLCGSVQNSYRRTRAEFYRLALEPQDYEMIDFFVKRFKLWLGVNKVKEYRHSVKFEGLGSYSTKKSPASSHIPAKTEPVHRPPSVEAQDPPSSPRPVLSPALAVEHLPRAISDLLDKMDKVTQVLKEVSTLEQRLKLWQIKQKSTKLLHKETPASTMDKQLLPRTYSTFSESALSSIKSRIVKSNSYRFSRWAAPLNIGLPRHPASAGQCDRARLPTRRPHSQDSSGGLIQNEDFNRPFPLKRRAWDSEKPGGLCHSPSVTSVKGSILS
ncbi:polycystin-1-like [Rana temporaria]|uniref:polycystin-1-like n=1 Tax=Rana temporaria TaxID=8407 RepID=UPI001AACE399|nr:polycystin-1-like [Rana temporaria]